MASYNPNLLRAARSPIMEAASWVAATDIPANRPLLDLSQAAPAQAPDLTLREHLAEAIIDLPSAHFYGPVLGNDALRTEIAAQWSDLYQGAIDPAQVAITAGCNQAFCTAIQTLAAPGDAIMLPVPWYFNHKMWLDMTGIRCIPLPVGPDMLPDVDTAGALFQPDVRAIVLVTPNNPTGTEYPAGLMDAFFTLAQDHDLALIVDETYRDFRSTDGPSHTLFQRPGWEETLIHLYSFSKAYRLTGHRTGAMIAGSARIAEAEKFLDTVTICAAQPGQIAALFGLRTLAHAVARDRQTFAERRAYLTEGMASRLPDWQVHGAGAYFAWVTPPHGLPAETFAKRLVAEQSVLVLPGTMFLPDGENTESLRIAFANADIAGLETLLTRLEAFRP